MRLPARRTDAAVPALADRATGAAGDPSPARRQLGHRIVAGLASAGLMLLAVASFAAAPAAAQDDPYLYYIGGDRTPEEPMQVGGGTNPDTDISAVLRVVNDGPTPLTISGFTDVTTGFRIDAGTCTSPVTPGKSCDATVTAHPVDEGLLAGSALIVSDSQASPSKVEFKTWAQRPGLEIIGDDDTVDFGYLAVGETSERDMRSIGLDQDSRDYLTATISDISVIGDDADSFDIDPDAHCTTFTKYASSCRIYITASPTRAGRIEATLRIRSDATNDPLDIHLSVVGKDGELSATPKSQDLGTLRLGVPAPFEITWTNTGEVPVAVSHYLAGGSQYYAKVDQADNGCRQVTLAPGDSCTAKLLLTVDESGPVDGSATITSSAVTAETAHFTAVGASTAMRVRKTSVDLGIVRVGTTRDAIVSVESLGDTSLTGVTTELSGDDAFSIVKDCGDGTVERYVPCDVTIRYAPTDAATHAATLHIATDSTDPVDVSVTGEAKYPKPRVSSTTLEFGRLKVWNIADRTLWLDTETVAFAVTGVSLAGSTDFSLLTDGCDGQTVGRCGIVVRARPMSAGTKSGHLRIETDADTTLDIPLSMVADEAEMQVHPFYPETLRFLTPVGEPRDNFVTVENEGRSPLSLHDTSISADHYAVGTWKVTTNGCYYVVLAVGEKCQMAVTLTGKQEGDLTGELTVYSATGKTVVAMQGHVDPLDEDNPPGVPEIAMATVLPIRTGKTTTAAWTGRVAWSRRIPAGVDASGATYELSVRTGSQAWKLIYKGTKTTADVSIPPGDSEIRVRARNHGLTSASRIISVKRLVSDQSSTPSTWKRIKDAASLGGSVMRNLAAGSKVAIKDDMSGVAIVVRRTSSSGVFDVYVDGTKADRVTVGKGDSDRVIAWQRSYRSRAAHRIEVRSVSGKVDIDGWLISR